MTLPGDVPYMGDGGRGGPNQGRRGWGGGKTYPMKTAARGASELRRSLSRSPVSSRCTSLPAPLPAGALSGALARSPATRRVLNKLEEGRNAGVKLGKQQLPRS